MRVVRILNGPRARKLLGEVGTITLGVLIALGLGKVADDLGWYFEVKDSKLTLAAEVSESVGQGIDRMRAARCIERRLTEIASAVNQGAASGKLPPMASIGWPPFHTYRSGAWESVLASQAAAHFPRDQLNELAAIYRFKALAEAAGQRETELWAGLSAIAGPGRDFGADEAAEATKVISQARFYNRYMALMGVRLFQMSRAAELPLDTGLLDDRRTRPTTALKICQPRPSAIPPAYGDGIWDRALQEVDDALRTDAPRRRAALR